MKKFLAFGFFVFLSFAPHVLAQGFTALAPIPGLTDPSSTSVVSSTNLAHFFNNLYMYLIGIAAILAVIQIIWAGIDMAFFHKDAVSVITDDKGKIYNAVLGLVLVLSPALVFSIINPSILNLSLNLPPIDLSTPMTSPVASPIVGGTQTCAYGATSANCATTGQAACIAAGGTPQTRGNMDGSQTITCVKQNANSVASSDSITADQCGSLVGHSTGGSQGLQPTVIPSSTAQDCSATNIQNLLGAYTHKYCKNLAGGGVCLYDQ